MDRLHIALNPDKCQGDLCLLSLRLHDISYTAKWKPIAPHEFLEYGLRDGFIEVLNQIESHNKDLFERYEADATDEAHGAAASLDAKKGERFLLKQWLSRSTIADCIVDMSVSNDIYEEEDNPNWLSVNTVEMYASKMIDEAHDKCPTDAFSNDFLAFASGCRHFAIFDELEASKR